MSFFLPPRNMGGMRNTIGIRVIVDEPADSVFHHLDIEIEQQSDAAAAEFQVGQDLGDVDRLQSRNGFEFYDNQVFNEQIHTVARTQPKSVVNDGHRLLSLDTEITVEQFVRQACLIGRFQQSRAELSVDHDRRPDNKIGNFFRAFHVPRRCTLLSGGARVCSQARRVNSARSQPRVESDSDV